MPKQDGRHFPYGIFKCIFFNENESVSIKISLKFVPKSRIHNIAALVQIMTWRQATSPCLNQGSFTNAYMGHSVSMI